MAIATLTFTYVVNYTDDSDWNVVELDRDLTPEEKHEAEDAMTEDDTDYALTGFHWYMEGTSKACTLSYRGRGCSLHKARLSLIEALSSASAIGVSDDVEMTMYVPDE